MSNSTVLDPPDCARLAGNSDAEILLAAKSPLMRRPVTAFVPGDLPLARAVDSLRERTPADAVEARRALDQIDRERSAATCHFLVVSPAGHVTVTSPETTLRDIAVARELRTSTGPKPVGVVAVEIQAYAPVGI